MNRARLSNRQLEVIRLVQAGLTNREIAKQLGIAEQTVKNVVSLIFAKCGARNRVQLIVEGCRAAGVEQATGRNV